MASSEESCIRIVSDQCIESSTDQIIAALQKTNWNPIDAILLLHNVDTTSSQHDANEKENAK
jgi:NACalpha-BTF3-like transcription factor